MMKDAWYVIRHSAQTGPYDNGVISAFSDEAAALAHVEKYTPIVRGEYLTVERRWHKS
jgi:hypothetical protein